MQQALFTLSGLQLAPESSLDVIITYIMVVVVPHNLLITDTALLWITDGENHNDFMPDLGENFDYNLLIAGDMATASGAVVVSLFQIPNGVRQLIYDCVGERPDLTDFTAEHRVR